MRKLRAFWIRIMALLGANRAANDFDAELETHIAMHTEDNLRAGMSPEEARRHSLIQLGGEEQTRQAYRDRATLPFLENILRDIRFALRQTRKQPGFTATAILTLALAIGANSAVFTLIHSILLRQLPFDSPERVLNLDNGIAIGLGYNVENSRHDFVTPFNEAAQSMHSIETAAIYSASGVDVSFHSGTARRLKATESSAQLLRVLGVTPSLGRGFLADEDIPGKDHVVLISNQLWHEQWNADPAVIGKNIKINAFNFIIIGVLPPRMDFPAGTDLWVPTIFDEETALREAGAFFTSVVVRTKPGLSLPEARAEFRTRAASKGIHAKDELPVLTPIAAELTKSIRSSLQMLSLAVLLLLLVACANLAALALARAMQQQSEFAVRTALGATQGRLIQQQFVEFFGIATAGGALGVLVAQGILQLLYALRPVFLNDFPRPAIDGTILAFAACVSILACLIFGFVPAWMAARTQPATALKLGAATHSRGGARLRKTLVAGEVAVAFVLLSGAGLLLRTITNLDHVPLGYDLDGILSFSLSLHGKPYFHKENSTAALGNFYTSVLERLTALPGVRGAAAVSTAPLERRPDMLLPVSSGVAGQKSVGAAPRFASSGYFRIMGIPVIAGRDFSRNDDKDSEQVAIVSRDLADKLWPGQNPIGKRFHCYWYCEKPTVVVGVVRPSRHFGPRGDTWAEYYMPYMQHDWPFMTFVVSTGVNPASLAAAVRTAVATVDASQAVYNMETMQERLGDNESLVRFELFTLGAFAIFAVLLVAIGLYGVVAYTVTRRTREIGIRIALGSRRGTILRSVIWEGAVITLAGVSIGLGASLVFLRLLKSVLFGVTAYDPVALGETILCFFAIAVIAAYLPARNAAAVDPVIALRTE